jgi:predicted DNA-binding protein (UPF0278 family)
MSLPGQKLHDELAALRSRLDAADRAFRERTRQAIAAEATYQRVKESYVDHIALMLRHGYRSAILRKDV